MNRSQFARVERWPQLGLPILGGIICLVIVLSNMARTPIPVMADPIAPPEGYPKLSLSIKSVTPTLATTGGTTLDYAIEIVNTGAFTAVGASLTDVIPSGRPITMMQHRHHPVCRSPAALSRGWEMSGLMDRW